MPKVERTDFYVTSATIAHHAAIPVRHTCDGEGVSPSLAWFNPPAATKSFAVVVDDPDDQKRNFVHLLVFNLSPTTRSLPEGVPLDPVLAALGGAKQGKNGEGKIGWTPICPPPGRPHRIVFRVYALDAVPDVPAGASRAELEKEIAGHFVGQTAIIASYQRK